MTRIALESEKIDDIKKQLEILVKTAGKIESDNYKYHIKQRMKALDEKEKVIIKFVKNNPGTSKQNVVDSVNYARVTVFRNIKNLVNYGIITQELDNQKHRLYFNDENVFTSVLDDIKSFKKSYINLIKIADEAYKNKIARGDNTKLYSEMIGNDLATILKHLIMNYSLYAVFEWPKMIKDSEGLNRLYLTVFQSLNEIFLELGNSVPFHLKERDEKIEFLKRDLMSLYGEFEIYEHMITEFHRYGLDMEFDTVMSNLFMASKMPRDWGDIRAGMEEQ